MPDGLYELWVGYNSPFGFKGYDYQVDSVTGSGGFDGTGSSLGRRPRRLVRVSPARRTRCASIAAGATTTSTISSSARTRRRHCCRLPNQLVDPQADRPTQMLMNYLVSQYGQKTLSGLQHNSSDNLSFPVADYLSKSGGVVPAIRGSDLIDYSPSRIAFGENPQNETEQTITWAKQTGGVVTVMWHWNAPANLINTPGKEWWRGFYTDATTFNLPARSTIPTAATTS